MSKIKMTSPAIQPTTIPIMAPTDTSSDPVLSTRDDASKMLGEVTEEDIAARAKNVCVL